MQLQVTTSAPVADVADLLNRIARGRRLLALPLEHVLLGHVAADERDEAGGIQPGQVGVDQARFIPDAEADLRRPGRRSFAQVAQRLANGLALFGFDVGQDRGIMRAARRTRKPPISDVGADHAAVLVDQRKRLGGGIQEMFGRAGKAALDHLGR